MSLEALVEDLFCFVPVWRTEERFDRVELGAGGEDTEDRHSSYLTTFASWATASSSSSPCVYVVEISHGVPTTFLGWFL